MSPLRQVLRKGYMAVDRRQDRQWQDLYCPVSKPHKPPTFPYTLDYVTRAFLHAMQDS